ncbi:MAG: R3H domain-containing nucleic acid-binding protein [Oligoflexus sp.]
MQNQTQEIRVTAKTLETALGQACKILDTNRDQLEYRIVSQTNGGLFSFLAKKVEIAAWLKTGKTVSRSGANGAVKNSFAANTKSREVGNGEDLAPGDDADRPELNAREVEELKEDLRRFCEGICSHVSGQAVKVTGEIVDERLVLDIDDEYLSTQIMKNAKLAESLEHILRKKPRHLKRELPFRIFVDVKGVRRKREFDLVELAQDLSEKVHENRRPIVLNYKSSYDRKIIHMALDKDDRVYTKSIGSGPNRKLMILPIKKKGDAELAHESYGETH